MKWTCDEVSRQLEAFLDGEAGPAAQVHLEDHLRACGPCRSAAEALRGLGDALRGAADEGRLTPEEAAAFWPAVRARIRQAEAAARRWSLGAMARGLGRLLRAPVLVPVLAVFLGVVFGLGVLREHLLAPAEAAEVESLEGGPASTVMLLHGGQGKAPIIWIFEDGAGAN